MMLRADGDAGDRGQEPVLRTVYVPIFKSKGLDRRTALMLTELMQQQIEKTTPYKVVGSPDEADFILEATLTLRPEKNRPVR